MFSFSLISISILNVNIHVACDESATPIVIAVIENKITIY